MWICRYDAAHLAHVVPGAEGVRVLGQRVAVALGRQTLAHHTPGVVRWRKNI